MDGNKNVTKISDSISKALERLFKAGGFALAFGFAGIILMIIANLPGGKLYWPLFGAGSALTFICLIYFVVEQSRSKQVAAKIGENAPLFDELQSLALHLIEFASLAQAFSFKHIQKVEAILKKVAPLIENRVCPDLPKGKWLIFKGLLTSIYQRISRGC
jgi:hypothetical protein